MKLESEKAGVILGFIGVSWVSRGTLVVNFVNKEYKELRGAVFKYYHTNAVEESMKPESPLRLLLLSSFIVGLLLSEHLMPIIVLVLACSSLKCLKGRVIICIPSSVCYTLETFAMMIV